MKSLIRARTEPNLLQPQDSTSSLSPSGWHVATPGGGDLPAAPSINGARTELLRSKLESFRAEQRAETEQLHKLEGSLSDSLLLEKKIQRKAAKQREMRDFHQQRGLEVERQINMLRQEIHSRENRPATGSFSQTGPNPNASSQPLSSPVASSTVPLSTENRVSAKLELDKPRDRPKSLNQFGLPVAAGATAASKQMPRVGSKMHSEGKKMDGQNETISASKFISAQSGSLADEPLTSSQKTPVPRTTLRTSNGFGGSSLSVDADGQAELSPVSRHQYSAESFATTDVVELSPQTHNRQPQPGSRRKLPKASNTLTQHGTFLNFTTSQVDNNPEEARDIIRQELIRTAGGEREAFRSIDINGSGKLSSMKFADGVTRLGIRWAELTGLQRPRELFSLFDQDKDGVITFEELFPCPAPRKAREISTPEFIGHWIQSNKDFEGIEKSSARCARWQSDDSNQKLDALLQQAKARDDISTKKEWMSSTIRRLKSRGKSDARCREIVASHLPRGTGPKDKEDVPIFSKSEARACQKRYTDEYMGRVKRIQKVVGDMKEQKRDLHQIKETLFMCTEAKRMQQLHEEHRKDVAKEMVRDGMLGGMLGKVRDPPMDDADKQSNTKTLSQMAEENDMDVETVSDLFRDFLNFADANELLGPKGFSRLLQTICPGRTLSESYVTSWWGQLVPSSASQDDDGPNNRKSQVPFEDFVHWFSTSEARSV